MSHRIQQVESVVKRAIAEAIDHQLHDPRVDGLISVTRVEVTADLRDATVFVTVMPRELESKNIRGLNHASGHIGTLISHRFSSRGVPRLRFKIDRIAVKQNEVLTAISEALSEDEQRQAARPAQESPPEESGPANPPSQEDHP